MIPPIGHYFGLSPRRLPPVKTCTSAKVLKMFMRSLFIRGIFVCAAFLSLAVFAPMANAMGMGRVNVLSSLGQHLRVEIELFSVSKEERATLAVKLGSAREYERSNVLMGAVGDSGIRASIEKRANGDLFVWVTSAKPINEPFVNLLIELTSLSGLITRQYSVLLDPPEIAAPRSVETDTRPPVAATVPVPAPQAPAQVADSAPPDQYGPIRRGETLSGIAARVRPQNATLQQTMVGIFRDNPEAFINNNMNLLKAGHRLRIPSADRIAATSPTESAQTLRAQTSAWAANRAAPAAEESTQKPRAPVTENKPLPAAKKSDGGKPVIKLSRGAPSGKGASVEDRLRMLEEDLAARERALNDANERIKRLEKAAAGAPAAGQK